VAQRFDRWKGWGSDPSWGFRLFISHHTELNELYWSHEAAARYVVRAVKNDPDASASQALRFSGIDERRLQPTVNSWSKFYADFGNWSRVSALIALSGYFEIYLRTMIGRALESDPAASQGAARRIDGAILLKYGSDYSRLKDADQVLIRPWSSRLKTYRSFFGQVPDSLKSLEGELEKLRVLRNDASHKFGRDMTEMDYRNRHRPLAMTRVGLPTLKRQLRNVEAAARAIDRHLMDRHIGAYEMVSFYHSRASSFSPGQGARLFRSPREPESPPQIAGPGEDALLDIFATVC